MTDDNRIAVLIDADNISARLVKEVFEELASYGTVTVKRAYGDWASPRLGGWRDALLGHAILPRQQFAYTVGKNATDSALIIDAMDLLYAGNVEGFAIVSSDSDFTPLAMRLRESGKRVIGVGQRKTPKAFVEACEKFVFLEVLGDGAAASGDDADSGAPAAQGQADQPDQPKSLHSLLTRALNRVPTDDDDWASLSALGSHLNRTEPSFDPRTYDFQRLSDLVKAQHFVETRSVTSANGHSELSVRLKGRRGAKAAAAAPAEKTAKKTTSRTASKKSTAKATTKKATTKAAKKAAQQP